MGGTAFTFLVGMPFQIYLARQLGAAGLGIVGIAEALVTTAAGFLSLGLAPLAMRYIPEYRVTGASGAIHRLVLLGIIVLGCLGGVGAVVLRPLALALPDLAGIPVEAADVLGILSLSLPGTMIVFFLAQSLRGFEEIGIVVFSTSVLMLSAKVAITLLLFRTIDVSVSSYAWAVVFAHLLAALPMALVLWLILRALPAEKRPTPVNWRAWYSFAGTNYANGLLSTLVGTLDRVVIGALLGPTSVGVFMVVRQLQQFPMVFHQVVLTVIAPIFARLKAAQDMDGLAHHLHLANDWVVRLAAGIILVMALHAGLLLGLFGPGFADQGTELMLFMTLAAAVNLGTGPVGILLNMAGHHVPLLRISVLTSLFTFGCYLVLIPLLGLVGAGLAVLFANVANNGAAIWLTKTRLGIRWYDPRFRAWIAPIVGSAAFLFLIRPVLENLERLPAQVGAIIGVTALAYIMFFGINMLAGLHEDDREMLRALRERIAGLARRGEPRE